MLLVQSLCVLREYLLQLIVHSLSLNSIHLGSVSSYAEIRQLGPQNIFHFSNFTSSEIISQEI